VARRNGPSRSELFGPKLPVKGFRAIDVVFVGGIPDVHDDQVGLQGANLRQQL
jgi:hypothetical protein